MGYFLFGHALRKVCEQDEHCAVDAHVLVIDEGGEGVVQEHVEEVAVVAIDDVSVDDDHRFGIPEMLLLDSFRMGAWWKGERRGEEGRGEGRGGGEEGRRGGGEEGRRGGGEEGRRETYFRNLFAIFSTSSALLGSFKTSAVVAL